MYAAELEILASDDVREYDLIINDKRTKVPYRPKYLIAAALYNNEPHHGFSQYSFTVIATANSTLPPMINAFEFFSVISTANVGTDSQDGKHSEIYIQTWDHCLLISSLFTIEI